MKRLELIEVLRKVQPGLASKAIIEQSAAFIFRDNNVMTYNDEVAVSHPIEFDLDFTGAVDSAAFFKYLQKIKPEDIEIKGDEDNTELIVTAKKSKAGFKIDPEITLPMTEFETNKKTKWTKLPGGFLDAIKLCAFSVSNDMSTPVLTCVHARGRFVESTDDHRITRVDLGKTAIKLLPDALLIPGKAALQLIKYPVIEYNITEAWIHFKTKDGIIFSCRTVEEKYPDPTDFLEVEGEIITLSPAMKEIIDKASIFAKQEFSIDEEVLISIDGGTMLVRAEGVANWFEEPVRVKREKKSEIKFRINPNFLLEALDRMRDCVISESCIKFEGDKIEHVIELMAEEE